MEAYKFIAIFLFILVEAHIANLTVVEVKYGGRKIVVPLNRPVHVRRITNDNLADLHRAIPSLVELVSSVRSRPLSSPALPYSASHQYRTPTNYHANANTSGYYPNQLPQNRTYPVPPKLYPKKVPLPPYYPLAHLLPTAQTQDSPPKMWKKAPLSLPPHTPHHDNSKRNLINNRHVDSHDVLESERNNNFTAINPHDEISEPQSQNLRHDTTTYSGAATTSNNAPDEAINALKNIQETVTNARNEGKEAQALPTVAVVLKSKRNPLDDTTDPQTRPTMTVTDVQETTTITPDDTTVAQEPATTTATVVDVQRTTTNVPHEATDAQEVPQTAVADLQEIKTNTAREVTHAQAPTTTSVADVQETTNTPGKARERQIADAHTTKESLGQTKAISTKSFTDTQTRPFVVPQNSTATSGSVAVVRKVVRRPCTGQRRRGRRRRRRRRRRTTTPPPAPPAPPLNTTWAGASASK